MVLGNLAAIVQGRLRRLLAYSAIAHAGYVVLGLMAMGYPSQRGPALASLVYYVATYGLTTVGVFADCRSDRAGIGGRADRGAGGIESSVPIPGWLSDGVHVVVGGYSAVGGILREIRRVYGGGGADPERLGLLWLATVAIAMNAVSLVYYLRVLKQAYVAPGVEAAPLIAVPCTDRVCLAAAALGVFLLGALPGWLIDPLTRAIAASGF